MIHVDLEKGRVWSEGTDGVNDYPLDAPEAFALVSKAWVRCGWDCKYPYTFSWMGRPIIQLPEDMLRIQECIYAVKPTLIIETGVAHGGSLIYYASILRAMGGGRVIGIDIEIRPQNRQAIESHEMASLITLVEGSSIALETVNHVKALVHPNDRVLVILDSNHYKDHVLDELRAYGPMVSKGSFLVATDGIMGVVAGAPRTREDWTWNHPTAAADAYLEETSEFERQEVPLLFNESTLKTDPVTYWPGAWLKRVL
jgi:cephalosporin hydroxylase